MDTSSILSALEDQRNRIDQAITALHGTSKARGTKRRQMSAAAKRRIGEAKRKWWAEHRKKK